MNESGASFSECRRYRYLLWRTWDDRPRAHFIMLNPSTADEVANDPTIERCEWRAKDGGYGGLQVTNLFAFRSTDPKAMLVAREPIGPDNDAAILQAAKECAQTICAWGNHGGHRYRSWAVRKLLLGVPLWALKIAKTGEPYHPLYLPYSLKPSLWRE